MTKTQRTITQKARRWIVADVTATLSAIILGTPVAYALWLSLSGRFVGPWPVALAIGVAFASVAWGVGWVIRETVADVRFYRALRATKAADAVEADTYAGR